MKTINLLERVGVFAENKDIAREIRLKEIIPFLEKGKEVVIDFSGIEGATQSFVHALISDLMRKYGNVVLERIKFKGCNPTIVEIITIVTDYMQEG